MTSLLTSLMRSGVGQIFVIDNSPVRENTAADENPYPELVDINRTGQNLGYGRGHNLGIRRSVDKYKYHLICNPDIVIPDGAIATVVEFMDENPDVGLCMPRLVGADGEMQYCCRRSPVLLDYVSQVVSPSGWGLRRKHALEMRDSDYLHPMEVQCLSGCFMVFRCDVLRKLGGFDERFFLYFEDFDLSLRAQRVARNVYLPAATVVHERQSEHRRSWKLKGAFLASAVRYFSKWGWF